MLLLCIIPSFPPGVAVGPDMNLVPGCIIMLSLLGTNIFLSSFLLDVLYAIIGSEDMLKDVLLIRSGAAIRRSIAVQWKLVLCTGFSEDRVFEPVSSSAAALMGASLLAVAS
jgi:hypothetical protein